MHELGILVHMAKTLKSLAEENQLTEIGGITLEVGDRAGIYDRLLGILPEKRRYHEEFGTEDRDYTGGNHL